MLTIKFPKEAELPREEQPKCVIKIAVGGKYFIGRSLNFEFIDRELRDVLKRYKYKQGVWETNLFYPVVKYIVDKSIEFVQVEILFKSESGYEILKEELRQLELNFGKRNCLNQNNIPHVPKFKTAKSTSKWLTHNEFLNFKKLLSKYDY